MRVTRLPSPRSVLSVDPASALIALAVAIAGAAAAALFVTQPTWDRWVLAAVIGGSLAVASIDRPRTAVLVTILCLPFLALLRRFLIAQAPWTSHDPLLAVGPLVAAVVLAALWIRRRRPLAPDLLSKLVLALLALTLVQTLNPNGSGPEAALGGLVFIAVPLLWFFIGREIGDRHFALVLLFGTVVLAAAIGAYGLWQAQVGLPRWDSDWLEVAGYNSLYVNHGNEYTIRPFGTFSSAAEYASYLGVGIAIAAASLLHRRWWPAFALPVLVVAVLFASGRTVLVLTVLGVLVMVTLRTKRPGVGLSILASGLTAAVLALQVGGPALADATRKLSNPLLSHVAEGLAHPLDPDRSTLVAHWLLLRDGVGDSIAHPLGFGTAATNIASEKLGSPDRPRKTEVDISNAFVSLGPLGGVLFVVIVAVVFQRVADAYRRTRDPLLLAVVGLLVVTLGQWLNGGHYALAPLTWLLVGYAAARRECVAPHDAPSRPMELWVRRVLTRLGTWGRVGEAARSTDATTETVGGSRASLPGHIPSAAPHMRPSAAPRVRPSAAPRVRPSAAPRMRPSGAPRMRPSGAPRMQPSGAPHMRRREPMRETRVRPVVQALKRRLLPPPGPRRLPLGIGRGISLTIDFQHDTRLYLGLYEIELNRYLRRLCKPGVTSFDVGGCKGYDALVLARLTGSWVVSFEADPAACSRMRDNFSLNQEGSRVRTVQAMVGAPGAEVTLDDSAAKFGVPGFVKIDVDGGEVEVLRGAESLLVEHRPSLIVETHSHELERQCAWFLADHGYKPMLVKQRRVWKERRPTDNRWLVAEGR
jgi:hypothetical protein